MNEEKNVRMMTKMYKKFFILVFLLAISCVGTVYAAEGVALSLSPASGSYYVGDTISLKIFVTSPSREINAISGVVSYPKDLLSPMAVSKMGSLVSLWPEEPSFSSEGVRFGGVIFNPVFKGENGTVLTVKFKAKASGEALLNIASGSVLANDGNGTEVLGITKGAKLIITNPPQRRITPHEERPLVIASSTCPIAKELRRMYVAEVKNDGDTVFMFDDDNPASCIDHYEVSIDDVLKDVQQGGGVHAYKVHGLSPGIHVFTVKAVDKEGNVTLETVGFNVKGGWAISWRIMVVILGIIIVLFIRFLLGIMKHKEDDTIITTP
ncbi:MAG: hypothetical protein HZA35_03325 [Parcubacteria group bacterium]|nr:hypothetical protein [Parcubacteria group bacterium]